MSKYIDNLVDQIVEEQDKYDELKADIRKIRDEWETHDRTVKDPYVGYWRRCCKGRRAEIDKLLER